MKTYKFKTNLKCDNCLKAVQNKLEEDKNLRVVSFEKGAEEKWLVVEDPENIGTDGIIEKIEEAGFKAMLKKKGILDRFKIKTSFG